MANLSAALEFLEDVTNRFPPYGAGEHSLLIKDGGLALQLWVGPGQTRHWPISNEDLGKHAYELMDDLEEAMGAALDQLR